MAKFEKKYTTEEVARIFAEQECELLATEYQDMLTPMKYRCSCGAVSEVRLFAFLKGTRCRSCGIEKMRQSRKLSWDFVKGEFEKVGYRVLSSEYVDNKTPIHYLCDKGHHGKTSYANFKKGGRCKQCFLERNSGSTHPNYNPDRSQVSENDKFRRMCRSLVRRVLKAAAKEKLKKSKELLGYTYQDLRDHLLQHPNMKDIGDKKWVIDHVYPIKAFLDNGVEDVSVINALDNLQPLEEKENLVKNASYSQEEFLAFLKDRGISVDSGIL